MATLMQLLKELEVDVDLNDDPDKKEDDVDLSKIEIDKIPEEHRKAFQIALDTIENLKNESSKKDLMLEGMKTAISSVPKEKEKEKEKEKVLGVVDVDDPYAPAFKTIADSINELKNIFTRGTEKDFKTELINFAKEHKDIVRYTKDMDLLIEEHPSLRNDIPKLYTLAKSITEGREKKSGDKKNQINNDSRRFSTENSGVARDNVTNIQNSKTINDAFEKALGGK